MSDNSDSVTAVPEEEQWFGHSLAALSDYLDRGRTPANPAIDASPSAQHALAALNRLRAIAPNVLRADADLFTPKNDDWITRILDQIGVQAHAGRDIPIRHDVQGADLAISEGAVRAIVREAGDRVDGVIVERCLLRGHVEIAGSPVSVEVTVSLFRGAVVDDVTDEVRQEIAHTLALHTELTVEQIIVTVRDTDLIDGRER